jgi:hypothetical protein
VAQGVGPEFKPQYHKKKKRKEKKERKETPFSSWFRLKLGLSLYSRHIK